ncbi:MAG: hypothetical protein M1539_00675 [Actinobacteria bacterium]|nr:hypothetical protein [Actinomycetota bacterium]MCL5882492.1 hypothetical protein [Actinomycetota bacterium]
MDPVEQISSNVQTRVDGLGAEIIRYAEKKQDISEIRDLSEADRAEKISGARDLLDQRMDAAFGEDEESIDAEIQRIVEASKSQETARERAIAAAEIWRQELPGLRQFLEYCGGMIAAHQGKATQELRESQKCLTEASCVMDKISARVRQAVEGK